MSKALVPLARTPAYEALLGVRMDALQADAHVWPFASSAHASTATATASLYFLLAW